MTQIQSFKFEQFELDQINFVLKSLDELSLNEKLIEGYSIGKDNTLTLYKSDFKALNKFLSPCCLNDLSNMVKDWLERIVYPPEPDVDGSLKKGFSVSGSNWYGEVIQIKPQWVIYHK